MRKLVLLVTLAVIAAGCRGKPKRQNPPTKVEQPGAGTGSGPKASPDLVLPKGPGTPPIKTTKPIDPDTIKRLDAMTFPGFKPQPRSGSFFFQVVQLTADHPKIKATIDLRPCVKPEDCPAMELAPWQAKTPDLKHSLNADLQAAPDTTWELGLVKLHGQQMVYTYQLGQTFKADGHGSYTDMYALYFNDGANAAHVEAHYADDPVKSKEAMSAMVSKEDLENVALSFMDVYTQAWAPTP